MEQKIGEQAGFKRGLLTLGAVAVTGLFILGLVNFLVDPFYQYHKPLGDMPVMLEDAVYQTAGAAKTLDYADAILGTSMTENFHTSWFDEELGWNTMKLSYSGARSGDLEAILTKMYENDREINHIFMDLNDYQLSEPAWTAYVERPEYLYDNRWWNDYRYLLNYGVLRMSAERVVQTIQGTESNIDSAYTWEDDSLFGRQHVYDACIYPKQLALEAGPNPEYITQEYLQERIQMCQDNLDNFVPFIEEHPETEFIIFLPPYSLLYWERQVLTGRITEKLALYEYSIRELLQYENVKMYYFQDEMSIIGDMDNYRDDTHHKPEYNRYIFDCIKEDKKRVTLDNYQDYIENMRTIVTNCDYDRLWWEGRLAD